MEMPLFKTTITEKVKRLESEVRVKDKRITELEKQLKEGEALVIELAAALEINQLRNE